jgi:2-keto-3-deoxy-L-arabinonate dehydratase
VWQGSVLQHKMHGIAALGLASDIRLSTADSHTLIEWVAEDVAGAVPVAVTVAETSIAGQTDFVKAAAGLGVKRAILQPPQSRVYRNPN